MDGIFLFPSSTMFTVVSIPSLSVDWFITSSDISSSTILSISAAEDSFSTSSVSSTTIGLSISEFAICENESLAKS